ncbi:MAG TPA: FixH family protein [Agriterribacter sp.]|nr:FixH family protein [Chitinophagaceae bacterium]HRP31104.1 FixH family protein [Agriterribacter sp.]
MNRIFSCAFLCALIFAGCKKENAKPAEAGKVRIAQTTGNNMTITLWADNDAFITGYNKFYVSVNANEGGEIKNAKVRFTPVMDMGTMKHSSPVEQPAYNTLNKLYEGAVIFTMPTSEMGSWQLKVAVNDFEEIFPVTIGNSVKKQVVTFKGNDDIKYVLCLVPPVKWQVGLNDLQLLLHRQASANEFPPVDGLVIECTPEMPSMGHGSPNNINPVSTGNGHYTGKVNFTMTGEWRLHFAIKKEGSVIKDDTFLDVLF